MYIEFLFIFLGVTGLVRGAIGGLACPRFSTVDRGQVSRIESSLTCVSLNLGVVSLRA